MDQALPKCNTKNAIDKYTSRRIRQLIQDEKQAIATARKLHRSRNAAPHISHATKIIDNRIKAIRKRLKAEIERMVNAYWHTRISQINTNQSKKMFREINLIFRKKDHTKLPTFKIPADKENLIRRANMDPITLIVSTDNNNNILISNTNNKLDYLGIQYVTVSEQQFQ